MADTNEEAAPVAEETASPQTPFEMAVAALKQDAAPADALPADPVTEGIQTDASVDTSSQATAPVAKPAEDALSPRFAKLMAEDRRLRQERQELEVRLTRAAAFDKAKAEAAADPIALLESLGLGYEQLTEFVLNGKKPTQDLMALQVKKQTEDIRAELEKMKQEAAQSKANEYKARAMADATGMVASSGDKYELVRAHKAEHQALEIVERFWQANGRLPADNYQDSLKIALDHLEQGYEAQVDAVLTTNKAKSRLSTVAIKPVVNAGPAVNQGQRPVTRTLTNSQAAPSTKGEPENLTPEALRAKALAALLGR